MKQYIFYPFILATFIFGCNSADKSKVAENSPMSQSSPAGRLNEAGMDNEVSSPTEPGEQTTSVPMPAGKQIVKTANITIEVKKNETYAAYLQNILKKNDAVLLKEDNSGINDTQETSLVIKVPVSQFEALLKALLPEDAKQLQRSITSEDVTSSVIDIKARLETRKATRDKYLELLKRASNMEDVLKVQQELNNVQEEIESAEARWSQLSTQASYSTIYLTYFEPGAGLSYQPRSEGFVARVGEAIKNGGKIFVNIFIGLITVWPIWLGIAVVVLIIKKWKQRNNHLMKKSS